MTISVLAVKSRWCVIGNGLPPGTADAVDEHMRNRARGRRAWIVESPIDQDGEAVEEQVA